MSAETGKEPVGDAAAGGGMSNCSNGSEIYCSGQRVSASLVRPVEVAPAAVPSATTCIQLKVRAESHRTDRASSRIASGDVDSREPDVLSAEQARPDVIRPAAPAATASAASAASADSKRRASRSASSALPTSPTSPESRPASQSAESRPGGSVAASATTSLERPPLPALSAPPPPVASAAGDTCMPERREPSGPPQGQELMKFHRLMRGRYKWAAALAFVGLLGGGYAGWKLGMQIYQSTGAIRVMAVVPRVMYQSDEKGVPPMFESLVNAHVSMLRSQRVMNQAMLSPEWAKLNRGSSDDDKLRFAENISVLSEGEMIWINAQDPDPAAAMVAVKTVINAYNQIREQEDNERGEERLDVLNMRLRDQRQEVGRLRTDLQQHAKTHGTDDLTSIVDHEMEAMHKLQDQVAQLEFTLGSFGKDPQARLGSLKGMSLEELAILHPRMQALLNDREAIDRKLRDYARRLGTGHNETILVRGDLQQTDQEIETLATGIREGKIDLIRPDLLNGALNEATLRQRLATAVADLEAARVRYVSLGDQNLHMQKLREDLAAARTRMEQTERRIEELNVESAIAGRTLVVSDGDKPLGPYRDTRIIFSAAGGLGGAMLGFGLIAGLALCDRRLRTPEQLTDDDSGIPMLGMLPRLSLDLSDPQEAATAAHCVHEIRTLLQIWSRTRDNRVFAITSPNPGTGKTSLTLALGAAYALAGRRTLLIDGDLVGAGLTTRVDAIVRRRIGRILRSEGLVTQEQLEEALRLSKHSAARLGEILIQLGYLSEHDLSRAVLLQQNDENDRQPVGLIDALSGQNIEECIVEVGINSLWVLPAGSANARYVPALTPEGLQRLINSAREKFDLVLIDTGPMPGSLEASIVTALSDGAILAISKGEHKALVQRSINQLTAVGAKVVGVVFNRASQHDITRYGSSSGASLCSAGSLSRGTDRFIASAAAARFGPLAQAVASFAPGGGSGAADDIAMGGSSIAKVRTHAADPSDLPSSPPW